MFFSALTPFSYLIFFFNFFHADGFCHSRFAFDVFVLLSSEAFNPAALVSSSEFVMIFFIGPAVSNF